MHKCKIILFLFILLIHASCGDKGSGGGAGISQSDVPAQDGSFKDKSSQLDDSPEFSFEARYDIKNIDEKIEAILEEVPEEITQENSDELIDRLLGNNKDDSSINRAALKDDLFGDCDKTGVTGNRKKLYEKSISKSIRDKLPSAKKFSDFLNYDSWQIDSASISSESAAHYINQLMGLNEAERSQYLKEMANYFNQQPGKVGLLDRNGDCVIDTKDMIHVSLAGLEWWPYFIKDNYRTLPPPVVLTRFHYGKNTQWQKVVVLDFRGLLGLRLSSKKEAMDYLVQQGVTPSFDMEKVTAPIYETVLRRNENKKSLRIKKVIMRFPKIKGKLLEPEILFQLEGKPFGEAVIVTPQFALDFRIDKPKRSKFQWIKKAFAEEIAHMDLTEQGWVELNSQEYVSELDEPMVALLDGKSAKSIVSNDLIISDSFKSMTQDQSELIKSQKIVEDEFKAIALKHDQLMGDAAKLGSEDFSDQNIATLHKLYQAYADFHLKITQYTEVTKKQIEHHQKAHLIAHAEYVKAISKGTFKQDALNIFWVTFSNLYKAFFGLKYALKKSMDGAYTMRQLILKSKSIEASVKEGLAYGGAAKALLEVNNFASNYFNETAQNIEKTHKIWDMQLELSAGKKLEKKITTNALKQVFRDKNVSMKVFMKKFVDGIKSFASYTKAEKIKVSWLESATIFIGLGASVVDNWVESARQQAITEIEKRNDILGHKTAVSAMWLYGSRAFAGYLDETKDKLEAYMVQVEQVLPSAAVSNNSCLSDFRGYVEPLYETLSDYERQREAEVLPLNQSFQEEEKVFKKYIQHCDVLIEENKKLNKETWGHQSQSSLTVDEFRAKKLQASKLYMQYLKMDCRTPEITSEYQNMEEARIAWREANKEMLRDLRDERQKLNENLLVYINHKHDCLQKLQDDKFNIDIADRDIRINESELAKSAIFSDDDLPDLKGLRAQLEQEAALDSFSYDSAQVVQQKNYELGPITEFLSAELKDTIGFSRFEPEDAAYFATHFKTEVEKLELVGPTKIIFIYPENKTFSACDAASGKKAYIVTNKHKGYTNAFQNMGDAGGLWYISDFKASCDDNNYNNKGNNLYDGRIANLFSLKSNTSEPYIESYQTSSFSDLAKVNATAVSSFYGRNPDKIQRPSLGKKYVTGGCGGLSGATDLNSEKIIGFDVNLKVVLDPNRVEEKQSVKFTVSSGMCSHTQISLQKPEIVGLVDGRVLFSHDVSLKTAITYEKIDSGDETVETISSKSDIIKGQRYRVSVEVVLDYPEVYSYVDTEKNGYGYRKRLASPVAPVHSISKIIKAM